MSNPRSDLRYADYDVADAWQRYEALGREIRRLYSLVESEPVVLRARAAAIEMGNIRDRELVPRRTFTSSRFEPGPIRGIPQAVNLGVWQYLIQCLTGGYQDPLATQRVDGFLKLIWPNP